MKKILALVISVCLIGAMLTGCYGIGWVPYADDDDSEPEDNPAGVTEISDYPVDDPYPDDYPVDMTETEDYPIDDSEDDEYPDDGPYPDDYPVDVTEPSAVSVEEVNVRSADWASVRWESYSNEYITLNIPSGWKVECQGDANQLEWMATSPDGTIGLYNIDHTYAAKDASMQDTLMMKMTLSDGTVQEYFETLYANSTDYFTVQNSCVPANKDALQSIRPSTPIRDYQALYATFKDDTVGEGEGIYSAVIMDSNDVIIRGQNYGTWEINCVFTQWAPLGQLVNWAPVLAGIAQSFGYTDYYLQQWRQIASEAASPSNTINDPDPVMEAFEERSTQDTIIQEKRSDMLEEYERVYDNSTGEIYRAYSGFLDDIGDQNRYTQITDSQYADGYVGWIDKD